MSGFILMISFVALYFNYYSNEIITQNTLKMSKIFDEEIINIKKYQIEYFDITKNNYLDFIIDEKNNIWSIDNENNLIVFDLKGKINNKIITSDLVDKIKKDKNNNIYFITIYNSVKKYNKTTNTFEFIIKDNEKILNIAFNKKNELFLLTSKGIKENKSNKYYAVKEIINLSPEDIFIDESDILWCYFNNGEFRGKIITFNTITHKITKAVKYDFNPVSSIVFLNNKYYITGGLSHLLLKKGYIYEYDGNYKYIISYENSIIGKATFFDNYLYVYSSKGLLKGNIKKDLSFKRNWEIILDLKTILKNDNKIGSSYVVEVLKIIALNENDIVILTKNHGIIYLNNKNIKVY